MANDNTLGAPTEGLGQKVTFQFDPKGAGQMDAGGATPLRAGVVGGGASLTTHGNGVDAYRPDPTVALLMKVGDELLGPVLQKKRTEHFVAGMQQAMQGAAIQDIAQNQPWYTKIFGDSDTVEGARAYLGHTKAQTAVAQMEDDMPELRKMEPQAAQEYFSKMVQKGMTGDPAADLSIMQGFTTALPGVMRRQAKEHFGWQQEQASQAEGMSFRSGAQRLQAAADGLQKGYVTQEEFDALGDSFVKSLVPAAGSDLKSWRDATMDNILALAEQGNFHAINAIKKPRPDGNGGTVSFFDTLKADQVNQIEKATEAGEQRMRTRYSFQWNDDLTKLEAQAARPAVGQTTQDILNGVDAINERYRRETGSSLGLVSPAERIAMGKGSALAIAHAKDEEWKRLEANNKAADTAAAKAAAEADKKNAIEVAAAKGDLYLMASTPGYSNDLIDSTLVSSYRALDPQSRDQLLVRNYLKGGYVIKPVAMERDGYVSQALAGGQGKYDGSADAVYKQWKSLNDINPDIAAAYYPKNGPRLVKFDRAVQEGVPVAQAFASAFVHDMGKTKADPKVIKAAVAEASSDYNSWLPGMLGGRKLRPEAANVVANYIGDAADVWTDVLSDPKAGAKRALELAKSSNRIEMLGGHAWVNTPGSVPLQSYLTKTGVGGQVALGTDSLDDVMEKAVDQLLQSHNERQPDGSYKEVPGILPGVKADTITINRLPDSNGVPQLHVMALHDGKAYDALLSADSMYSLYERHKAEKKEAKDNLGKPFAIPGGMTNYHRDPTIGK
jgi:chemotaxis protein histidine kinase CheA